MLAIRYIFNKILFCQKVNTLIKQTKINNVEPIPVADIFKKKGYDLMFT